MIQVFLKTLNDNNLLLFSKDYISYTGKRTKQGNSIKIGKFKIKLLKNKKLKDGIKQIIKQDTEQNKTESLNNISNEYNKLNHNSQKFLNELINYLIETLKNKNAPVTFEGLSIERAPFLDTFGARADHYYHNEQKVRICTNNFPIPLTSGLMTVLTHEFTHAVDDICFNLISVHSFLSFLIKDDNINKNNIMDIIKVTAKILDEELYTLYLPEFLKDIKEGIKDIPSKNTKNQHDEYDFFQYWYERYANKTITDDKGNNLNLLQAENGNIYYSATPPEFLTFYIEKIFDSINTKNFKVSLTKVFQANITKIDKDLTIHIKSSIEFIKYIANAFQAKLMNGVIKQHITWSTEVLNTLIKDQAKKSTPIKIDVNKLNSGLNNLVDMSQINQEDKLDSSQNLLGDNDMLN